MYQTLHSPSVARTVRASAITLAALLTAAAITACGGGGGGGEPTATTVLLSATQLQGRWQTTNGVSPASTAIVLPGSASGTELWLLANDLSTLSRLQVSTSGTDGVSATGKTYNLLSSAANPGQSYSASGTANLSNNTLSLNAGTLLMSRTDTLAGTSNLSDAQGNWSASAGNQSLSLSLSVAVNGALSGSSSTGCSYSGALTARSDTSAYGASLTETCNSVSTSLAGIATYRAAQTNTAAALTLALTSTDPEQTQALVLVLKRP